MKIFIFTFTGRITHIQIEMNANLSSNGLYLHLPEKDMHNDNAKHGKNKVFFFKGGGGRIRDALSRGFASLYFKVYLLIC